MIFPWGSGCSQRAKPECYEPRGKCSNSWLVCTILCFTQLIEMILNYISMLKFSTKSVHYIGVHMDMEFLSELQRNKNICPHSWVVTDILQDYFVTMSLLTILISVQKTTWRAYIDNETMRRNFIQVYNLGTGYKYLLISVISILHYKKTIKIIAWQKFNYLPALIWHWYFWPVAENLCSIEEHFEKA